MNADEKEDSITLGLLGAIEEKSDMTQRHLAERLGVALGLANSYLKRCVRKGLIKIQEAPANRYLYYLTPKGFNEKSRLTARYLSASFDFYRQAGDSITVIYDECEAKDLNKILLCGISELAEVASLRAQEHNVYIIGTYDPTAKKDQFLHLPVWHSLTEVEPCDAYMLTALNHLETYYQLLIEEIDKELVLVPSILGLKTSTKTH